jgi:hypothetical protein
MYLVFPVGANGSIANHGAGWGEPHAGDDWCGSKINCRLHHGVKLGSRVGAFEKKNEDGGKNRKKKTKE